MGVWSYSYLYGLIEKNIVLHMTYNKCESDE